MKNYEKLAEILENKDFEKIGERVQQKNNIRLLHATLGLSSETGEFADQIKKHIFYGTDLDLVNLEEEIGDLFWYLAVAANTLGISFDAIQEKNIAKLKKRYGEKFSEEKAQNRNLPEERKILEEEN